MEKESKTNHDDDYDQRHMCPIHLWTYHKRFILKFFFLNRCVEILIVNEERTKDEMSPALEATSETGGKRRKEKKTLGRQGEREREMREKKEEEEKIKIYKKNQKKKLEVSRFAICDFPFLASFFLPSSAVCCGVAIY